MLFVRETVSVLQMPLLQNLYPRRIDYPCSSSESSEVWAAAAAAVRGKEKNKDPKQTSGTIDFCQEGFMRLFLRRRGLSSTATLGFVVYRRSSHRIRVGIPKISPWDLDQTPNLQLIWGCKNGYISVFFNVFVCFRLQWVQGYQNFLKFFTVCEHIWLFSFFSSDNFLSLCHVCHAQLSGTMAISLDTK